MHYKPDNMPHVMANLTFKESKKAAAFYEKALGVTDVQIMESPGGKVMHGMMRIGESVLFFNDEFDMSPRREPDGPGSISFYVYVPDVDAAHDRAVEAGMTSNHAPETMFWGDRTAVVTDPYNYIWTFSTRVAEPSPEEIAEAQKNFAFMDTQD